MLQSGLSRAAVHTVSRAVKLGDLARTQENNNYTVSKGFTSGAFGAFFSQAPLCDTIGTAMTSAMNEEATLDWKVVTRTPPATPD